MMTFYLAICRNRFYFYSDNCKPVYLDGEPFFEYESGKIREATGRLTEKIVDENNLSNANELRFLVIENSVFIAIAFIEPMAQSAQNIFQ